MFHLGDHIPTEPAFDATDARDLEEVREPLSRLLAAIAAIMAAVSSVAEDPRDFVDMREDVEEDIEALVGTKSFVQTEVHLCRGFSRASNGLLIVGLRSRAKVRTK